MFRSNGIDKFESKRSNGQKQNERNYQKKDNIKKRQPLPQDLLQSGCCCIQQYQQEISILQQKLMQTHNKLITQLDVCQEQQLTIIQLTKKIIAFESSQNFNNFQQINNDQNSNTYSGEHAEILKDQEEITKFYKKMINNNQNLQNQQNIDFTLNNSINSVTSQSNYMSPTFVQANRNQLLKKDLEIMRVKLLQQITEKSKLSTQLTDLKTVHTQKIQEYKKKIKDLEHDHEYLVQEYEYTKKMLQTLQKKAPSKGSPQNSNQTTQLTEKYNELEKLYRKQVILTKQQNQKISQLKSLGMDQKQKIKQLQSELQKYSNLIKSTSTVDGYKDQRQQLCGTIRITRNPGTLWQKDSNKSKITSAQSQLRKRQKNNIPNGQSISSEISFAKSKSKNQNKQNFTQTISSKSSIKKQRVKKTASSKEDYESTKELIRKLQEAEMQTRQRKKPALMI